MKSLAYFLERRSTRNAAGWVALILAAIIIYLSVVNPSGVPAASVSDKLKHFVAYAALATPFCAYMGRRRIIYALILVIALGISMEIAQALAGTGRSPSVLDAVANALGAGTSGLIFWGIMMRAAKSSSAHQ